MSNKEIKAKVDLIKQTDNYNIKFVFDKEKDIVVASLSSPNDFISSVQYKTDKNIFLITHDYFYVIQDDIQSNILYALFTDVKKLNCKNYALQVLADKEKEAMSNKINVQCTTRNDFICKKEVANMINSCTLSGDNDTIVNCKEEDNDEKLQKCLRTVQLTQDKMRNNLLENYLNYSKDAISVVIDKLLDSI